MLNWIIDLFLDRYNGYDFDTARMHVVSHAETCGDAIADAKFRAQAANPTWNIQAQGSHCAESSPYPENWHDSGME
jgi:hypothetical protein